MNNWLNCLLKECLDTHLFSSIFFNNFQADKFPVTLQKLEIEGNPLSIIVWTSLIRKESKEFTYTNFSEFFVHPLINMLKNAEQPRINDEMNKILQLSKQTRTGDWYLYEKHTEIRVFGSNLLPYKLPKYVPMRVLPWTTSGKS